MSMRIEQSKLEDITSLSRMRARKTVTTKKELQSILGKIMLVSKVVPFSCMTRKSSVYPMRSLTGSQLLFTDIF